MKFYDLNSHVPPETMWVVCLPELRRGLRGGSPSGCLFLIRDELRPDWSTVCFLGIGYLCECKLCLPNILQLKNLYSYECNMLLALFLFNTAA